MRKCYFLLLLPFAIAGRRPAAVTEDVYDYRRPSILFRNTIELQNGMQKYMNNRRQQRSDIYTMDIQNYNQMHEIQQKNEEFVHDKIKRENSELQVRWKREGKESNFQEPKEIIKFILADAMIPEGKSLKLEATSIAIKNDTRRRRNHKPKRRVRRDAAPSKTVIKFELEDAKQPDKETEMFHKKLLQENPNLRMPFVISDTIKKGDSEKDTVKSKRESGLNIGEQEKTDMSTDESRRIKVTLPISHVKKQVASYDELPTGVQKAIDIALAENERLNKENDGTKYYFGDKKVKAKKSSKIVDGNQPVENGSNKQWWAGAGVSDLNRQKRLQFRPSTPITTNFVPLVTNPKYVSNFKPSENYVGYNNHELSPGYKGQNQEQNVQTYAPQYTTPTKQIDHSKYLDTPLIKYVLQEFPVKSETPKITVQPSISISYEHPKETTIDIDEANHYGHKEQKTNAHKVAPQSYQSVKLKAGTTEEEKSIDNYYETNYNTLYNSGGENSHQQSGNEEDNIAALAALIGQRPSIQLQGLNELLNMNLNLPSNPRKPQENTSPIMFPLDQNTPQKEKQKVAPSSYSQNAYEETLYRTVQSNPQLQLPVKDHTPIKEVVSDIIDYSPVGPTIAPPTHESYVIGNTKENLFTPYPLHSTTAPESYKQYAAHHASKEYQHYDQEHDDSHGYTYGYRVRDYNTGNDFGHVQNKDNGVTKGEYHILLPDGRVQSVKYTADETGFHADVSYEPLH